MGDASGYDGGVDGFIGELRSGVDAAPTPRITSRPPDEAQPKSWQAPDLGASGHLAVHTDDLTAMSATIRSRLADVRSAINEIQQHYGSFDSLSGWPQGQQMCDNLLTALDSFAHASQQTHDAHAETAGNLKASAHTYTDTEARNAAAAKSVGTQASGGWQK